MSKTEKLAWPEMHLERDGDGLLTPLALAVDAISDHGCNCGTCLACVCDGALWSLWDQREKLRVRYGRLTDALMQSKAQQALDGAGEEAIIDALRARGYVVTELALKARAEEEQEYYDVPNKDDEPQCFP